MYRGPRYRFQHLCDGSQLSGTPAVEDLISLSGFREQLSHPQRIKDRDKF